MKILYLTPGCFDKDRVLLERWLGENRRPATETP